RGGVVSMVTESVLFTAGPATGAKLDLAAYVPSANAIDVKEYLSASDTTRVASVVPFPSKSMVIVPASFTVTSKVGVLMLVRLSLCDAPVSLAGARLNASEAGTAMVRVWTEMLPRMAFVGVPRVSASVLEVLEELLISVPVIVPA